ncbi:MAG: MFS transporter [Christensenellales bacterium]|jgi:fucose permease
MTVRQKRLYTAALLGAILFMSFSHALRGSLLSSIIEHYKLTDSQQGMPSAVIAFGSMLAMLLSFTLMGRVKKPSLLLLATGAAVLLLIPQFLEPAFGAFLVINLLFGIALGIMDTLTSSSMADIHSGKRATIMMSLLHACYGLGGIISPMIYGALLNGGAQWNYLFLVTALFGAALLVFMTPVTVSQAALPISSDIQASGTITRAGIRAFFKNRQLAALTALTLFFGLFFGGVNTWIIRFVGNTYSQSLGDISLSLLFLGVTAGRLITPFTGIDQMTYLKYAGLVAWALLSLGLVIGSGAATLALICLAFLLSGATLPYALNAACAYNRQNTMLASTMLFFSMYIGQAIGAPLVGAIEARAGLITAMAVCYLFAALASLCAFAGSPRKRRAG